MKFKDLKIGDKFIIPISPHIGKSEDDIDVTCYMRLYTKISEGCAEVYRRKIYGFYICKSYIEDMDIKKIIPEDEDVIIINKEDF